MPNFRGPVAPPVPKPGTPDFMGPARGYVQPPWYSHGGSQLAPTVLGGIGGAFSGYDVAGGPEGVIPGAVMGAAALNPRLRQLAARYPGMQAAMRPVQHSVIGGAAGHGLDMMHSMAGNPFGSRVWDPESQSFVNAPSHLGRTMSRLGLLTGGVHGGAATLAGRLTPGGTRLLAAGSPGQRLAAGVSGSMNRFSRGVENFGVGALDPLLRAGAYPFKKLWQASSNLPMAGRIGFMGGSAALGAGALHKGMSMIEDRVRSGVGQGVADVTPHLGNYADEWMTQRGLLDPQTGQVNTGNLMGGLTGGVDKLFQAIGMNPGRMSPLQKLMILGGTVTGAGGLIGGAPGMAAGGGLAALGGLLPYLLQSQGQHGAAPQSYTQAGYSALPPGQLGYAPPNQPGYRNEWQHQQQMQGP